MLALASAGGGVGVRADAVPLLGHGGHLHGGQGRHLVLQRQAAHLVLRRSPQPRCHCCL